MISSTLRLSGATDLTGRTLALDTSSRAISVALLEGDRVLAEARHSPETSGSSRLLVPAIQQLMQAQGWRLQDLEQLVLPLGPGSFSGLRMGLVTAKLLAYGQGLPVAGLNTLQVLAFRGASSQPRPAADSPIIALLDAQRGELFAQAFQLDPSGLPQALAPREIVAAAQLPDRYPCGWFTGSGLRTLNKGSKGPASAAHSTGVPAEIATRLTAADSWDSTAAAAGQLAARLGSQLSLFDCWSLVPDYGRPSAAEEKAIDRSQSTT